jgi:hypothetical protein
VRELLAFGKVAGILGEDRGRRYATAAPAAR